MVSIGDDRAYSVPTNPELVKIPERFPSSVDLYHLWDDVDQIMYD